MRSESSKSRRRGEKRRQEIRGTLSPSAIGGVFILSPRTIEKAGDGVRGETLAGRGDVLHPFSIEGGADSKG